MITKQSTTLGALLYGTDCMTVFSNLYVFSPYTDCIQHEIYVYEHAVKIHAISKSWEDKYGDKCRDMSTLMVADPLCSVTDSTQLYNVLNTFYFFQYKAKPLSVEHYILNLFIKMTCLNFIIVQIYE